MSRNSDLYVREHHILDIIWIVAHFEDIDFKIIR